MVSEAVQHLAERGLANLNRLELRFMAELATLAVSAEAGGAEIVAELGLVVAIAVLLLADLHAPVRKCALH